MLAVALAESPTRTCNSKSTNPQQDDPSRKAGPEDTLGNSSVQHMRAAKIRPNVAIIALLTSCPKNAGFASRVVRDTPALPRSSELESLERGLSLPTEK